MFVFIFKQFNHQLTNIRSFFINCLQVFDSQSHVIMEVDTDIKTDYPSEPIDYEGPRIPINVVYTSNGPYVTFIDKTMADNVSDISGVVNTEPELVDHKEEVNLTSNSSCVQDEMMVNNVSNSNDLDCSTKADDVTTEGIN